MDTLVAYFWVTLALVLTPGATTAVVIRQSLIAGARAGIATAAGAALANTTHAVAAGVGLAVIVTRLPILARGLAIGGAAYLLWLAWQSFLRVWRSPISIEGRVASASAHPTRSSFRNGLVVNLLNPAIVTFYLVVVPTFLRPDAGWTLYALLAAIHVSLAFTCHVGWSALIDRIRHLARSQTILSVLDATAAIALVFLAWRAISR